MFQTYEQQHQNAVGANAECSSGNAFFTLERVQKQGVHLGIQSPKMPYRSQPTNVKPSQIKMTRTTRELTLDGERFYTAEPDCYNGARRDLYSWSQSIKDLDIRIDQKHLRIDVKGSSEPLIDKDFLFDIKKQEALWSLDLDERHILINLDKVSELWWEAAFVDEEKIDVQKIDCSRPMHELDDESQAKIAQMLFDQEQKRLGLPTSEEKKIQEMLKGAWNKDGSPFKGTKFDPSVIDVSGAAGPGVMPMPPNPPAASS
ncbi:hypothetical protein AAHC03_013499 [Spirometra sp. Aus1]